MRIGYGTSITVPASTELWLSLLRAGNCFSGYAVAPAVAAQLSIAQLFNPVGSGKEILVRLIFGNAAGAMGFTLATYNVALAALDGNGVNLLSGGAAGVGELRHSSNAAVLGTGFGFMRVPNVDGRAVGGDWIIELAPGKGIAVNGGAVNIQIEAWFMWAELT